MKLLMWGMCWGRRGGEVNGNKDLPECSCEMRILDAEGFDGAWVLQEVTLGQIPYATGFSFVGQGTTWNSNGVWVPLPSEFRVLDPSGEGCHRFSLVTFGVPDQDFVLSTEVRCTHGVFGGTTVYPQFVIPAEQNAIYEYRYFSCEVLIEGEVPPCPPEKTSGTSSQ